ncbi:MAG: DNA/RNA non-specific endonuclease [Culturomica sp.]|nr:DNA/RNA non-specific endonuclease [Culturomica sp.]
MILLLFFPLVGFTQYEPECKGELIKNTYYTVDYNAGHKQPNWVYYMLVNEYIAGEAKRSNNFQSDERVSIPATLKDYRHCGYDRGHLCPAADMTHSTTAMDETFLLSNMSPQDPSFNRGRWNDLEDQIRKYVKNPTDTIYVVTGPIFLNNKGHIGDNKVTIPGFYYKVVYCPKRGGVGFIMPNQKVEQNIKTWIVSIDIVESLTGIDFFPQLPPQIQDCIEAQNTWW